MKLKCAKFIRAVVTKVGELCAAERRQDLDLLLPAGGGRRKGGGGGEAGPFTSNYSYFCLWLVEITLSWTLWNCPPPTKTMMFCLIIIGAADI